MADLVINVYTYIKNRVKQHQTLCYPKLVPLNLESTNYLKNLESNDLCLGTSGATSTSNVQTPPTMAGGGAATVSATGTQPTTSSATTSPNMPPFMPPMFPFFMPYGGQGNYIIYTTKT